MRCNFAHIRHPSTTGIPIDFAVFDAKSNSGFADDNSELLFDLTMRARGLGLKIDQSALAYRENGQIRFWGDKNLVQFLSRSGLPRWTHCLDV